ncbi:MAG: Type 1 glutamine amidotransferase-like domain-containing protein [Actinomycetota bacterium]
MTRAFALLGSGEFDPWTSSIDRWLLGRDGARDGPVLILPTASAAEGDDVFDMWARKGLDHYDRHAIDARVLPLKTRDDAQRDDLVVALEDASVAFFSGGNPAYLSAVLVGTPFWSALLAAMDDGLAYAGCSAGVACLGDIAPDSAREEFDETFWQPGLKLFPGFWFGPHWDALDGFAPGLTDFIVSEVPPGATLVGIDENTALVGDGRRWDIVGVGGTHILIDGEWAHHEPGGSLDLALSTA